jgi:hypothetical protein
LLVTAVVLVWWSAASDRREQSLAELVGNNVFSFINREGQRNYVSDYDFLSPIWARMLFVLQNNKSLENDVDASHKNHLIPYIKKTR